MWAAQAHQGYFTQANLQHKPESPRLVPVYSDILKKKVFPVITLEKKYKDCLLDLSLLYCNQNRFHFQLFNHVQTGYYSHSIFSTSVCSHSAGWQELHDSVLWQMPLVPLTVKAHAFHKKAVNHCSYREHECSEDKSSLFLRHLLNQVLNILLSLKKYAELFS